MMGAVKNAYMEIMEHIEDVLAGEGFRLCKPDGDRWIPVEGTIEQVFYEHA